VQSTKPAYAREDVTLHGVTIPKGTAVMPLLGAANHDPTIFPDPEVFDIARTPNRHLGFGQGIHYCLGAPLARMETRIALQTLIERNPHLRLAVEPDELVLQPIPSWQRYSALPVVLG
jgi:cytochrome P450